MFVDQKGLIIYSKVLLSVLGDRERVKEARSIVLGHYSSSTLVAVSYITLNVGTQTLLIVLGGDQLERFSLS